MDKQPSSRFFLPLSGSTPVPLLTGYVPPASLGLQLFIFFGIVIINIHNFDYGDFFFITEFQFPVYIRRTLVKY